MIDFIEGFKKETKLTIDDKIIMLGNWIKQYENRISMRVLDSYDLRKVVEIIQRMKTLKEEFENQKERA